MRDPRPPTYTGGTKIARQGLAFALPWAAYWLGVTGGELLIPALIFVFGADIRTAGSAVLFVSIPTVCMSLFCYGRMGLLPGRATLLRVGMPMGIESILPGSAVSSNGSSSLLVQPKRLRHVDKADPEPDCG